MPAKDDRILKDVDPTLSFKEYQKIYNKRYYENNKERYYKITGMKSGAPKKDTVFTEEELKIRESNKKDCPHCGKTYYYSKWRHSQTKSCKLAQAIKSEEKQTT